ncbi:MAG: MobF family relaxase [Phycisphaerales bacterium]
MLNITPSRNADAARDYFARSLSPGDYYAERGGIDAVWLGKGAQRLGLHGEEVTGDVFDWLVHNRHPFTGDRLTLRDRKNRLPGYDFTFHAPKSVSVLEAMGDSEIRRAFRDAVRESMAEIEADMQRVRKGSVHEPHDGQHALGGFVHDTTRPVDGVPDQCMVVRYAINACFDEIENCWKAGKFRSLMRDAPYSQAKFLNTLAFRMQALGYETVRTKHGFEIAGVPASAIKSFSRRSRLIDELAEKYGIDEPRAKARIGQWSREGKSDRHTREHLVGLWHDRMTDEEREAVFDTLQRASLKRNGLVPTAPDDGADPGRQLAPSDCLRHAIEHCYERRSVVSDRQLAARAIAFGIGRIPSTIIDGMIAEGRNTGLFPSRQIDDRVMVTTHEVLDEERRMLDLAVLTRGTCFKLGMKLSSGSRPGFPPGPDHGWMYSIDDGDLSPEQYAAAERVLHSRDRIIAISGGAGVGKTRLMREIARGAAFGGSEVFAFAPSAETVEDTLKKSGFTEAKTVAHLLANTELQNGLGGKAIWVDEAGQLGAATMRRLIELAIEQNARLILTGDTRQHTAVERGDALRLLRERAGIVPAELQIIRRQKGMYKEAVEALASGEVGRGFEILDDMGAVVELEGDAFDRYEALAKDYADAIGKGKSALVVSPTHAEGERVTQAIREQLKQHEGNGVGKGRLTGEDRTIERLAATEWTAAERADPVNYAPGLVVQFHQNVGGTKDRDRDGFTRGERVEITRVELDMSKERGEVGGMEGVWCVDGKGRERELPLEHAARFDVHVKQEIQVAAGEQLRVTKNARIAGDRKLVNGQMVTVTGFTRRGDLKLDSGAVIPKDFGHLAHGYCTTSHAAQGKTVDAVFIAQGVQSVGGLAASSMEQFYVSASRARESITIYTDDKQELRAAIQESERRLSASELVEGPDGSGGESGSSGGGSRAPQRALDKSPEKLPNPVRDRAIHNARLARHTMLRESAAVPMRERVRERSLPNKQINPKFLAAAYRQRALKGREMEM